MGFSKPNNIMGRSLITAWINLEKRGPFTLQIWTRLNIHVLKIDGCSTRIWKVVFYFYTKRTREKIWQIKGNHNVLSSCWCGSTINASVHHNSSFGEYDGITHWGEEIKLSNHVSSALTEFVSLFRCHDQWAWVALTTLSRPCPKLASWYIEIEGLGLSNLYCMKTKLIKLNIIFKLILCNL